MRYLLNAMHLLPPSEAFDPPTASRLMCLLLLADVINPAEENPMSSESKDVLENPIRVTEFGSFHGGALRVGYNIEKSKLLGVGLYLYGWGMN